MPASAPELYRHYGPMKQINGTPPLPQLEYGMAYQVGEIPPAVRSVIKMTQEKLLDTIGAWAL
jgi:hypothetical protein